MKNTRYQGFTKVVFNATPIGYDNRARSKEIHASLEPSMRDKYSIQMVQGRMRRINEVKSEKVFRGSNETCYMHKLYWRTI